MAGAMAGVALELGVRMTERDPADVDGAARFATELFLGGIERLGAAAQTRHDRPRRAELRPQPQQLDQLGPSVQRIGDRRAAVERQRGAQPPIDLRHERRPRGAVGRVQLGEQLQALGVGGRRVAQRHARDRRRRRGRREHAPRLGADRGRARGRRGSSGSTASFSSRGVADNFLNEYSRLRHQSSKIVGYEQATAGARRARARPLVRQHDRPRAARGGARDPGCARRLAGRARPRRGGRACRVAPISSTPSRCARRSARFCSRTTAGPPPPAAASATLDRAASRARVRLRFRARRRSGALEPEAGDVDGALGRILAIVHASIADGTWTTAEGLSRAHVRMGLLRSHQEPLGRLVQHGRLREPSEGARLPRAPRGRLPLSA